MSDQAHGTPAHTDTHGVDEPAAFAGELDRAEEHVAGGAPPASADERGWRLQREAVAVEILRRQDFTGPDFNELASRLLGYARPVLLGWLSSGEIFRQARKAGCPVKPFVARPDLSRDDRIEIVHSTLLAGLESFRDNALRAGRWDPAKGASLQTYFVRACVYAFRKVYTDWIRHRVEAEETVSISGQDGDPALAIPDARAADPCHTAVVRDQIDRALSLLEDPRLRQALGWRSAGYTQEEAADRTGLTIKALEGRLARARSRVRAQNTEGGTRP
ncbi:RNA polymerase sigma factor [[Kitasatospora] papulosa]|uniref:RNA polymerase sigma factor n=1 Tax=[Kitasatospora] papulosa TaxID=1464011 RepID=UPI0037D6B6D1